MNTSKRIFRSIHRSSYGEFVGRVVWLSIKKFRLSIKEFRKAFLQKLQTDFFLTDIEPIYDQLRRTIRRATSQYPTNEIYIDFTVFANPFVRYHPFKRLILQLRVYLLNLIREFILFCFRYGRFTAAWRLKFKQMRYRRLSGSGRAGSL